MDEAAATMGDHDMGRISRQGSLWVFCCWAAMCLAGAPPRAADKDGPSKLELSGAEHRLAGFEEKVRRMRGQPFPLGAIENEALNRIKALTEKYPDDPKVKELFERARKAVIASQGETVEIQPGAASFRENAKKLSELFAAEGEKQFQAFKEKALAEKNAIANAFPPPDPAKVDIDDYVGRTVVLPDFKYPDNEFTYMTSQYCFVGSAVRGYYYVELGNRAWVGAREAVRRYTRALGVEIPQAVSWTLAGTITGVHLLVPQAGEEKTLNAYLGWLVEPKAIYVPGYTFALADAKLELGGTWAGEDRVEETKSATYTVREIPPDVTPDRLVAIFATAIMERNYKLYLDCIDPDRRKTPKALSRINYHWDLHQQRFAKFYVKITVEKPKVWTVEGYDADDKFTTTFLTKEEREKIAATAKPLVEAAEVRSKAYDERGLQYGSPKPHFLKRVAKKRWYITDYAQQF